MARLALGSALGVMCALSTLQAQSVRTITLPQGDNDAVRVEVSEADARVSRDGGNTWRVLQKPDTRIMLHYSPFDPLMSEPTVPVALRATTENELFVVQWASPPIEEYRQELRDMGVKLYHFIPWQAQIVRMKSSVANRVAQLPFVRWVGEFHLAYRLESEIRAEMMGPVAMPTRRYHVMPVDWTPNGHARFLAAMRTAGVNVVNPHEGSILVDVELSDAELRSIVKRNDVLWIDRWTPIEHDVDNARIQGGADALEPVKNERYTGKGIRGYNTEAIYSTHPEFAARPPYRTAPIRHRTTGVSGHGNSVNGIIFASGVRADARGLCPDAQCIASSSGTVGSNRDVVTREAVDPSMQYRAMFMTASWGNSRTTLYNSAASQMDNVLFKYDIAHTQSQSNAGATSQPRGSRPQAWAKNMISVGGVRHGNNSTATDDRWNRSGSIGPASDGRVKPDISAYYDQIRSTSGSTGYTESFGGTSGATPTVAGHVGLIQEMYTDGIFGNALPQPATWQNRFANRPHMTTTKTLLVNTARRYPMLANDNRREHVGYGFPNVKDLYDLRNNILVINETEILTQGQSRTWAVWVKPGATQLAASMNYADPAGAPNSTVNRINNVDLKVTAPNGTIYWGNNGLWTSNWSSSGGTANMIDTLENVFIQNPTSGIWTVEVIATQIVQDGHVETPAVDQDFALVVSGIGATRDRSGPTLDVTSSSSTDLKVSLTNLPAGWTTGRTFFSLDTSRPVGFGWAFGLEPDTVTIDTAQIGAEPFFFSTSTSFPGVTYQFPAALAQVVSGLTLDAVAVTFNNGVVNGISNVSRVMVP